MQNTSKKHWLVMLAMCGLAISAVGFPVMSNGVFITPMAEDLNIYRGSIAMQNTMTLLFKAIFSLYAPQLIRKFTFKKVIATGVIFMTLANIFIGFSSQVWLFNLFGILRGIGSGMVAWVPITMVINEWFERRIGLVTSVVLSFSSIGGAIFSPLFSSLIILLGWGTTYQIMGVLTLVFALPALLLQYSLNPRDSGYLPYGASLEQRKSEDRGVEFSSQSDLHTIPMLAFALLLIFSFFQTTLTGMTQHFPGFSESIGSSVALGASLVSAAMISSIMFKLLIGYISDFIGPVKGTMLMLIITLLGSIVILMSTNANLLLVGAFLYGAVYTMPSVGVSLLTRHFFGMYLFPRLYPKIAFATSLGSALSLSAVGYIYDYTGSYALAFVIAIIILLIDMGILLYLNWKLKRETEA